MTRQAVVARSRGPLGGVGHERGNRGRSRARLAGDFGQNVCGTTEQGIAGEGDGVKSTRPTILASPSEGQVGAGKPPSGSN